MRGEMGLKILVVEDDLSIQRSIGMGLRKFGYAVDAASDGEEALQMVEIHEYDAIVLDWNLPKIDGIEVLREIRNDKPDIKVLILSARSEVDDKIFGLDTGANDYMVKPFHFGNWRLDFELCSAGDSSRQIRGCHMERS
jgi:DNA-binding response OmpR family regulator